MERETQTPTLFSRIFLILVGSLVTILVASNILWVKYYESNQRESAAILAEELAISMSTTVNFFGALPHEYRHIVLQQLRSMGGARFFVSVNDSEIAISSSQPTALSDIIINEYTQALRVRLGSKIRQIIVNFAQPQSLKVFHDEIMFTDLPARWVQNSLILPDNPPLLVAQVQMDTNEWLYLAALLPDPYFLDRENNLLSTQTLFVLTLLLVLSVIFWFLTKWVTKPLASLTEAARHLGKDPLHPVTIDTQGNREVADLAHAFNVMQQRLHRYIEDREQLFTSISHDLKTPITRLRLRAEFVSDTQLRSQFIGDLVELEALVKGALQYAKGTHNSEALIPIDLMALLANIQENLSLSGAEVLISGHCDMTYEAMPSALKRCLSNVIENAVQYGHVAKVHVSDNEKNIQIVVNDNGPGIPEAEMGKLFEPFTRLSTSANLSGSGLGLSISRNLAHAHGGELFVSNAADGGLSVTILLPHN
jgi:signal transduction histidine kinase